LRRTESKVPIIRSLQRKGYKSLLNRCLRARFDDFGQTSELSHQNRRKSLYLSLFFRKSSGGEDRAGRMKSRIKEDFGIQDFHCAITVGSDIMRQTTMASLRAHGP